MCACEKGACSQNRDSFVCMSGVFHGVHTEVTVQHSQKIALHITSLCFLKVKTTNQKQFWWGSSMYTWTQSTQARCFQGFKYCMVSVQNMHAYCTHGQFDGINIFHVVFPVAISAYKQKCGWVIMFTGFACICPHTHKAKSIVCRNKDYEISQLYQLTKTCLCKQ